MAGVSVANPAATPNITIGTNTGMQGSTYSPQTSVAPAQGSSPNLQASPLSGIALQNTANPQVVATFGAPQVTAGNALLSQGQQLLNSINGPAAPVYAPSLDLAAINAQARAAAEANVNPFYTKSLNDFLTQQASEKAQQEGQTATNIQNLKDTLTNTQNANEVTGERATEDTATKEEQAAEATDWRQTDQGGQYDMNRIAMAVNQAKSGLTGSGLAGGAQKTAQDTFNTTESRQATTDAETKAATELGKARTFEDLATSNTLAGQTEATGESQANVDLTNFITNQGFALTGEQNTLEQNRLQAVASETTNQAKLLINNFISSISNPAQRLAAIQAYGNAF